MITVGGSIILIELGTSDPTVIDLGAHAISNIEAKNHYNSLIVSGVALDR